MAAGSGVVMRRLQAEKARPLGDIVWGVSRSLLQTNKTLFEPYVSKNRDATPAEYRDPDNLWIGNNLHLLVILQNTKIVPEAEAPKSWADLLDPKWKGKIAFTDPANSGSAYTTVTMLVDLWGGGEAGWKKVAAAVQEHEGAEPLVAGLPGRRQRRVSAGHLAGICRADVGPGRRAGEGDLSEPTARSPRWKASPSSRAAPTPRTPRSSSTTSTARTCAR